MHVYGDESGGFGKESYFLLGLLLTREPHHHEAHMELLRDDFAYRRQIEYKKTDRLKLGIAKAVIDYFVACDDLEFQAILISTAQYDLRHYRKAFDRSGRSPSIISYNYRSKQLILRNTSRQDDLILVLDGRTTPKTDNLAEYLTQELGNVRNIQFADSAKHNLIQLADLLTGSVFGDVTNTTHPVKREIVEYLRRQLEMERLTERPHRLVRKFRVYRWQPPRGGK